MDPIKFSTEQQTNIVDLLTHYFDQELDYEISQFEAEFLIEFMSKNIGAYYYNKGLIDAQASITLKLEDLVYELEKPTEVVG